MSNFIEDFIDTTTGTTTVVRDDIEFGSFNNIVDRNSDEPKREYQGLDLVGQLIRGLALKLTVVLELHGQDPESQPEELGLATGFVRDVLFGRGTAKHPLWVADPGRDRRQNVHAVVRIPTVAVLFRSLDLKSGSAASALLCLVPL